MRQILIIAPAWVGDIVMMQVLLRMLKKNHTCEIDVVAPSWAVGLINRMPEVRRVHGLDLAHGKLELVKRFKFAHSLLKYKYSHAYVLPNSLKSALIPYLARITHRIGYLGELRYGLLNQWSKLDKVKLPRMIDRFAALANLGSDLVEIPAEASFPSLMIDKTNQQYLIDKFNLDLNKPIIALCPGAKYGEAKRWPIRYFTQLAISLVNDGYMIILLGGVDDGKYATQIKTAVNSMQIINLCGLTSLTDTVDLLASSVVAVSNDSGLMHIACSLDILVIAIYGSSSPLFTPPLSNKASIMYNQLDCSPCFQRTCKFGHYKCLTSIEAYSIYEKIKYLISNYNHR